MRFAFIGGLTLVAALWSPLAAASPAPAPQLAALDAGFAQLMGDFGPTAKITARRLATNGSDASYQFSDGSRLIVRKTSIEPGKVSVNGLVGSGRLGLPVKLAQSAWGMAFLPLGGTSAASYDEIEHWLAAAGRSVELNFNPELRAFRFWGTTAAPDIGYQLALLCGIVRHPGLREVAVRKAAEFGSTLELQIEMNPQIVLARAIGRAASGLGPRYDEFPLLPEISQHLAQDLQSISERELGGPVDLAIVGDVDPDTAATYVASTCAAGARTLRPRQPPVLRAHFKTGESDWTFVKSERSRLGELNALVWPTAGFARDEQHHDAFRLLAAILRVRMSMRLSSGSRRVVPTVATSKSYANDNFGFFAVAVDGTEVDATKLETLIKAELKAVTHDSALALQIYSVETDGINKGRSGLPMNQEWAEALAEGYGHPEAMARLEQTGFIVPETASGTVREAAQWLLGQDKLARISLLPRR